MKSKFNQPKMHFVSKGWGHERWIVNKDEYCGKLLYFAKERRCSFHYHKLKDETFYLQSGRIRVYFSDELEKFEEMNEKNRVKNKWNVPCFYTDLCDTCVLEPGSNFYVPRGRLHQMVAELDSELFEFSTYHADSDSYRVVKGD